MSTRFAIIPENDKQLLEAIAKYKEYSEAVINDYLHNKGGEILEDSVRNLIPESKREPWKGKAPAAKTGKSLYIVKPNLGVGIITTEKYGYLWFPDDGSNTLNHAGNQQFFARGGEAVADEIIERLISRLVNL